MFLVVCFLNFVFFSVFRGLILISENQCQLAAKENYKNLCVLRDCG
jgi:hypothetical protein